MSAIIAAASAPVLLLSVTDTARAIDSSRSQVYVLFTKGELGWVQIGNRRKVEITEVERYVAAHRVRRDVAASAEGPPLTADADRGQPARAPARQPHRQAARRPRAGSPGLCLKAGEDPA